jgi:hypothetical protein
MSPVLRIGAAVAALVCVALAALAVVLALDLRRWESGMRSDDLRFQTTSRWADLWEIDSRLPYDPAKRLLDVDDDLAYREGVRMFRRSQPRESAYVRRELTPLRAEATLRLLELANADEEDVRRAEAANFVGVLAFVVGWRQDTRRRGAFYEAGVANFQTAVSVDPTNEDAKFNLELGLRRLDREVLVFDSPDGNSPRENASKAGLLQPGSGY